MTAATAEENIDAETLPWQVPREKEERVRKKEDRGEVPRKTPQAHGTPSTASGRPLTHDRSACGAVCMWSASHITGVALTVGYVNFGKIGR